MTNKSDQFTVYMFKMTNLQQKSPSEKVRVKASPRKRKYFMAWPMNFRPKETYIKMSFKLMAKTVTTVFEGSIFLLLDFKLVLKILTREQISRF